jgi:hypothetical protein
MTVVSNVSAIVQTPEDLVNVALARIGYKRRIDSIYEGSPAADAALDIYGQTRDAMLRENDWGFAERNLVLGQLKMAPLTGYIPNAWTSQYPPLPWIFEYAYPFDCLKVRAVKATPFLVPNFDPQPNIFEVANDLSLTPPAKVILCNVPNAVLTYTGQVTDLTTWEADAIEAFAAEIGRRLAPVLLDPNAEKLAAQDAAQALHQAAITQG